jgi:hypothetical protein
MFNGLSILGSMFASAWRSAALCVHTALYLVFCVLFAIHEKLLYLITKYHRIFLGNKALPERKAQISQTSVNRLSRQCAILNISQPYWLPKYVTDSFTFSNEDDVRTSQTARLWASTACYGNSFTLLYVDVVHTSQEAHLRTSTACYWESLMLIKF